MFATCSYKQFVPGMGVPVRITAGRPRMALPYELRHTMPQFAPFADTLRLPYDEFRRAYRAKLHRQFRHAMGAADIIRAEAEVDDDTPLVLLCFEDLSQPGLWCHRTILAHFIEQKTAREVAEYGDHLVATPVPAALTAATTSTTEQPQTIPGLEIPGLTAARIA